MSRITWVLPPMGLSGGVRVASVYAQKLQERGHHVQVVAPKVNDPSWPRRVRSLVRGRGWPKVPRHRPNHFEPLDIPVKVLDSHRPVEASDVPDADIIIATWWETAQWVSAMPASKGAQVYFIQGDESVLPGQSAEAVRATWRLPMRQLVVAQWLADLVEGHAGSRPAVVPNSVDSDIFYADPRERGGMPVVGTLISKDRGKGADICLEAIRLARQEIPGLTPVGFGEMDPAGEWALDAGWRFEQSPAQHRIRAIYASSDVWLYGSRREGFGLPILEAMACRTPVIGTPAGAAPQLLTQGGGVLVPAEDPEAMAQAVIDLFNAPPQDWRAKSDAAHQTATGYSWEDAADLFATQLEHAMQNASSGLAQGATPCASGRTP